MTYKELTRSVSTVVIFSMYFFAFVTKCIVFLPLVKEAVNFHGCIHTGHISFKEQIVASHGIQAMSFHFLSLLKTRIPKHYSCMLGKSQYPRCSKVRECMYTGGFPWLFLSGLKNVVCC